MKKISKIDVIYLVFAVIYLVVREWPFGSTLQTVADVLVLLALLSIVIKYMIKKK